MGNPRQRNVLQFATHFWSNVQRGAADECWPWTRKCNKRGYGQLGYHDPVTDTQHALIAHRVAYHLTNGAPGPGMCVCHKCDNPSCCNPSHLYLGTFAENNADRSHKGRTARPGVGNWRMRDLTNQVRGERSPKAILTADDVRTIRALCADRIMSQRAIAKKYGVTQSAIMQIHTRRNWTHID